MRPAEAHGASTAAPPSPASFGPAKGDSILTDRTLSTLRTTTTTKKSPFRAPRFSRGNNLRTEKLPSSASQKKRPKIIVCHQRGERADLASALQLSAGSCQQGAPATDRIGDGSHMELP